MSKGEAYIPGDPWVYCDRSGFVVRMSDTVKEPKTNLRVARRFADPVNPLDTLRAIPDRQMVRDARPEPPDSFIDPEDPILPSDL